MCHKELTWRRRQALLTSVLLAMAFPWSIEAQYSPGDTPVGWTGDGLLFFRSHVWVWEVSYTNDEAYDVSCEGSGLYALTSNGSIAEILTGEPTCDLIFADHWDVSEDGGALLVGHRRGKREPDQLVSLLDLSTLDRQIFHSDEAGDLQSPEWVAPGAWAFVASGYPTGMLRITRRGPAESRLVAELSRGWIEDFDRANDQLIVRSYAPGRDTVMLFDTLGRLDATWPSPGTRGWTRKGDLMAYLRNVNHLPETGLVSARPADWALIVRDMTTGEDRELFRTEQEGIFEKGHSPAHTWGPFRNGTPMDPLLWSLDGSYLVVPRIFDQGTTLWRVPLNGAPAVQLTFRDPGSAPTPPRP